MTYTEADYIDWDDEDRGEGADLPAELATWPDLDGRCEDLIREAFAVLNEAPGHRPAYAQVQQLLAQAVRILRDA